MTELVESGGSLVYAILGLGGFGLLVILGLAGVAFTKRRVPVVVWVLVPTLVAGIGALGSWSSASGVFAEVNAAAPEMVATTALDGLWKAMTADWLSRWVAAALFGVSAWAAAIGSALAPGPDRLWTVGAAVMSFSLTVVTAVTVGVYAYMNNVGAEGYALAALVGFGGLGVSLAATRRAIEDDHMFRVAAMRFASSVCFVLGVGFAARAISIGNRMSVFGVEGLNSQNLALAEAIAQWNELAAPVSTVAWIALGGSMLIAWFGFVAELGEVVQRFTLIDVVLTMVILGMLGGVRIIEHSQTDALFAIGTHGPANEVFDDLGSELPPALVSIDKEGHEVIPADGGFSDVFKFEKVVLEEAVFAEDGTKEKEEVAEWRWNRRFVRTNTGWSEDNTNLADIQATPPMPLLAIEGSKEAIHLVRILEKVPEGKALILLRAAEVKGDVTVPYDLAYRQITFMPIQLSHDEDLLTEIYAEAGARKVFYGPIQWFGETDDERELVKFFSGIIGKPIVTEEEGEEGEDAEGEEEGEEETEGSEGEEEEEEPGPEDIFPPATVFHQLVDERARVKSVVGACLPWMMEPQGEAMVRTDRVCTIAEGDRKEWSKKAAELWEKPEAENVRLAYVKVDEGELEENEVEEQFAWQAGALQYCFDQVANAQGVDEDKLRDRLILDMKIRDQGSIKSATIGEKNKQELKGILKCMGPRVKQMEFRELPEEELPEPEEGEEEPEPRPLRQFQLAVDFR